MPHIGARNDRCTADPSLVSQVHYVNDAERGVVWEEVIILLPAEATGNDSCASQASHVISLFATCVHGSSGCSCHRFQSSCFRSAAYTGRSVSRRIQLCLGLVQWWTLAQATVPNYKDFAGWVGRTKQRPVCAGSLQSRANKMSVLFGFSRYTVHTSYRPTPLRTAPRAWFLKFGIFFPLLLTVNGGPGHFMSFRGHTLHLMDDAGSDPKDLRNFSLHGIVYQTFGSHLACPQIPCPASDISPNARAVVSLISLLGALCFFTYFSRPCKESTFHMFFLT